MGGSGGSYRNWKPDRLAAEVRKDTDRAAAEFQTILAGLLSDLLSAFNDRDVDLVQDRLGRIKDAVQVDIEASFDQVFGGSVAKHTYVDGLSDIDSLLVVNGSEFERKQPARILNKLTRILGEALNGEATVEHGKLAVTVRFNDGMVIQLLPAIRIDTKLRIPSSDGSGWASINPEAFRNRLVNLNSECGGKLVPTIKLAKAVIGNLPSPYHLSGYHVESLAVEVFANYRGEKTTSAMLPYFFEHARDVVLKPLRDTTGQSLHVDEDLGGANSSVRKEISHVLAGISKRMRNASAHQSRGQWSALFFEP